MQHPPIVDYVAPQARERGRQQGIQETTRENILEILTFRLQTDVEQTLKPALEAIDDLQRLKQLFRIAMQVETLEEFTQALNENNE